MECIELVYWWTLDKPPCPPAILNFSPGWKNVLNLMLTLIKTEWQISYKQNKNKL